MKEKIKECDRREREKNVLEKQKRIEEKIKREFGNKTV